MGPAQDIARALALEASGDRDGAFRALRKIAREDPRDAAAIGHLGRLSQAAGNHDAAEQFCLQSLELEPNQSGVWLTLGLALGEKGETVAAEKALLNALSLDPGCALAHLGLASLALMKGQKQAGVVALERALDLDPGLAAAYPVYARIADLAPDGPVARRIAAFLEDLNLAPDRRADFHYALAFIAERAGDTKGFFVHLAEANQLQHALGGEWRAQFDSAFETLKEVVTPDFVTHRTVSGPSLTTPVFIVGLPRSGSTLLEQMLASHDQVTGGGELPYFPKFLQKVARARTGLLPPEAYRKLRREHLAEVSTAYLNRITRLAEGKRFVTDKLPWNYQLIGAIAATLPAAKIIHIRRNALECGFSSYRNRFAASLPFCCDFDDFAYYCRRYLDVMEFWDRVLPGLVFHIAYEDLVAAPEQNLKRLCGFIGLDWQARMLAFHETRRPVKTLSQLQVLEPLDATRAASAAHYHRHLAPLRDALARHNVPF